MSNENPTGISIEKRLQSLEEHLRTENPVLVEVVQSYRQLDRVGRRMGMLGNDASYATQIPWWPLISVMGTFSAGKSSFINNHLQVPLQRTGNQAVDDKFTVISYSDDGEPRVLPGVALDSDLRFPFYRFSEELEKAQPGEGRRIDAYLQLKTCTAEPLRGKVLIDSPGFDADRQRTATLRITDHMIELSDLVLVFFDARHPEPGAMRDTLEHLVRRPLERPDSGKFLYILNQLDTAAREDNPEEVVAAWQRALAEQGLTAGRFYCIYNPSVAVPIEDGRVRERFEQKRDRDLREIHDRIQQVEVSRAYRIVGTLENTAVHVENKLVPRVTGALGRWRNRVLFLDALATALLVGGTAYLGTGLGWWHDESGALDLGPSRFDPLLLWGVPIALLAVLLFLHFQFRRWVGGRIARRLEREDSESGSNRLDFAAPAFRRSTRWWRSVFLGRPAGWGARSKLILRQVTDATARYVQRLNDHFARPDLRPATAETPPPVATTAAAVSDDRPS